MLHHFTPECVFHPSQKDLNSPWRVHVLAPLHPTPPPPPKSLKIQQQVNELSIHILHKK